ncbi:jerky protein-like [Centruroides vittatus]|uniref:jerky protein-like n=1 Tax=Centruroides vittatus TaxID=120091 RepID=UPI00350FDBE7
MNMDKRKRIVLTIEQKANIIMRLRRGENMKKIMEEFKIGKSTVYDLKRDADKILHFAAESDSMAGPSRRRTMKKSQLSDLDEAVYQWFTQRKAEGLPVSGPLITEKAMQMYRTMNIDKPFSASTGWLKRFKSRHGIRQTSEGGLTIDKSLQEMYREEFRKIMEEKANSQQSYTGDERGTFLKCLISRTLSYCQESSESWEQMQKDSLNLCEKFWNNSDNSEEFSETSELNPVVKLEVFEDIEDPNSCSEEMQNIPDKNELFVNCKEENFSEILKESPDEGNTKNFSEQNSSSDNLTDAIYHATKLLEFLEQQATTDPVPYLQVVKIRNSILQQRAEIEKKK